MTGNERLALLDIDGVLADDRHRVQYALDRDWVSYFSKDRMADDDVWQEGLSLAITLQQEGWTIAYLTGRREDRRAVTEQWLDIKGFPMGRLIMRSFAQTMRLAEFKCLQVGELLLRKSFQQLVLFDDDPEVIKVVGEELGSDHVIHCTWHIKEKSLIKHATA